MKNNVQGTGPENKDVFRAFGQERIPRRQDGYLWGTAAGRDFDAYQVTEAGKTRVMKRHKKYTNRARNICRAWNRVQLYLPEFLTTNQRQSAFEMSTAHGAMLEVQRHFGHDVPGNCFANMVRPQSGEPRRYCRTHPVSRSE
jgi:hypothetical protein